MQTQKQGGYTLIEVMVVVVIVGIITAIALPNYKSFVITSRVVSMANDLHGALSKAKSTAALRGNITICKSSNPSSATPSCDTSDAAKDSNIGWASWIMFIDVAQNGVFDSSVDTLLGVGESPIKSGADGSIIPVQIGGGVQPKFITFTKTGQITSAAIRFEINPPKNETNPAYFRYVCVGVTGRISNSKTQCLD